MRGRDLLVSVAAISAALLALQGTPDVNIQLRWILKEGTSLDSKDSVPVPVPTVTDLDGDGRNEVLVLGDGGKKLRVLSIPAASGVTLVAPRTKNEIVFSTKPRHHDGSRAVAIAAGYLQQPAAGAKPTKHVVVVRENWTVLCYDHELGLKWTKILEHEGSSKGDGAYVVDQVAIATVPPRIARKEVQQGGEGVVIVGGSMRHRDGHHHARAPDRGMPKGKGSREADPLGVHVEAFVEGKEDSRDKSDEAEMSADERERHAAEQFSMIAMSGDGQAKLWNHGALVTDHEKAEESETQGGAGGADMLARLKDLGAPGEAAELLLDVRDAESGDRGRRYRSSLLLSLLPYSWSSHADTRLGVTKLRRRGPGDGGTCGGEEGSAGDAALTCGGEPQLGGDGGDGDGGGGRIWAAVARTREGLRAVHLRSGKPLAFVALPAASSGAGVYADINGDHKVDHVQVVGTRGGHGWGHLHGGQAMGPFFESTTTPSQAEKASGLPPCYALAVSGLPPTEQLFNGSLCHDSGALSGMQARLSSKRSSPRMNRRRPFAPRDVEVDAAPPVVLPRPAPLAAANAKASSGANSRGRGAPPRETKPSRTPSDIVFAVSNGVVTSYDEEGKLRWQDRRGPTWGKSGSSGGGGSGGYVVPFYLEADADGRRGGRSPSSGANRLLILVAGADKMCVYDRDGRLVGSTTLEFAPSQRPVPGDFDGDGWTDFVVVGASGSVAGYALASDHGVRLLFIAALVLIAAVLVVAAVFAPGSGARGSGAWRRGSGSVWSRPLARLKRSTD